MGDKESAEAMSSDLLLQQQKHSDWHSEPSVG